MPIESSHDPRDRLVREKYFSLRPKPLERWIWQQGLPPAAERVFWLHWEEGMRNRDWCSQVPLKRVASLCCVDPSTVTRAYQLLKSLELIRREDPGRDPANPFQQATAITEVRIPRALLTELGRHPSRLARSVTSPLIAHPMPASTSLGEMADRRLETPTATATACPTRAEIQRTMNKLSAGERGRLYAASRNGGRNMQFDDDTRLAPEERGFLLSQLEQMSCARSSAPELRKSVQGGVMAPASAPTHRLTPLELARARRAIAAIVPTAQQASETLRQLVWAVEEGALRRFDRLKALNIALKKIREGAWSRPNRMPPNWLRASASPEICSAA
jgi:hypothetical protein